MSIHTVCKIKIWFFEEDHRQKFDADHTVLVDTAVAQAAYDELVAAPWFADMKAEMEDTNVALTLEAFRLEVEAVKDRKTGYNADDAAEETIRTEH